MAAGTGDVGGRFGFRPKGSLSGIPASGCAPSTTPTTRLPSSGSPPLSPSPAGSPIRLSRRSHGPSSAAPVHPPGATRPMRKCHEFETDLGAIAVRQTRNRRSDKINMSREVRPYRQPWGKTTEDQRAFTVKLYASGETTVQIGQYLQVSPSTVNYWLHRCGVTLRGPRETSTRCKLRHDALDELTPSAAYWIGFLFADGSVSYCGQSGKVSLRISERDRDHIVQLRTFLGSTYAISVGPAGNYGGYKSKPSVHFTVTSARLAAAWRQADPLGEAAHDERWPVVSPALIAARTTRA
jgi:Homeodomain-like domain